jgi:hypothetical protein
MVNYDGELWLMMVNHPIVGCSSPWDVQFQWDQYRLMMVNDS